MKSIHIILLMFWSILSYSQNFIVAEKLNGQELTSELQQSITNYSQSIDSLLIETSEFTIFDASMYNLSTNMGETFIQDVWADLLTKHTTNIDNFLFISRVYNEANELTIFAKLKIKKDDPSCSDPDVYDVIESNQILINAGIQEILDITSSYGYSEEEKILSIIQYTYQKLQYICCDTEESASRLGEAQNRSVTSCNPNDVNVLVALKRENLYYFILGEIRSLYQSSSPSICFDETSLPAIDYSSLPLNSSGEENYYKMPLLGNINITLNNSVEQLSCPSGEGIVENIYWNSVSDFGVNVDYSVNVTVFDFGIFTIRYKGDDFKERMENISLLVKEDLTEYQNIWDSNQIGKKWNEEWLSLRYLSSRDINYYENPIKYRFLVAAINSAPEVNYWPAYNSEKNQSIVTPPTGATQFIYNLLVHIGTGDNYKWLLNKFENEPENLKALLSFEYEDEIGLEIVKIIIENYNLNYFNTDDDEIKVNGVNIWEVPNLSIALDKDWLGFYKDIYKFEWKNESFGGINFNVITSDEADFTFNAFDPIVLNEIDVENFSVFDTGLVPACVLPYITKFAEEENDFRSLMIVGEVVSLAFGGGVLYRGLKAGSYFYIASGTLEISANLLRNILTNSYDFIEDDELRLKVRKYLTIIEFAAGMSTAINLSEAQRVTFTLKMQEAQNLIKASAHADDLHQVQKIMSIAELSMKMPQGKLLQWINTLNKNDPKVIDYLASLGNLSEDVLKEVSLLNNNQTYLLFCKGITDPDVGLSLRLFFNSNLNGVKAWKGFFDFPNLRVNIAVLDHAKNWGDDLFTKFKNVGSKNPTFYDEVNNFPVVAKYFDEGFPLIKKNNSANKEVELDMYALDRSRPERTGGNSIFESGNPTSYKVNTTKVKYDDIHNNVNPQSGKIKDNDGVVIHTDNVNGEGLMYAVDEAGNIHIGTRGGTANSFPHPTLIGGINPNVKSAGMIKFNQGRILEINNNSGHFKPSAANLQQIESIFQNKFPANSFDSNFSFVNVAP